MYLVISERETGKAYVKITEEPVFVGKKIGDEVDLSVAGVDGYKAQIRGGSDDVGFPMRKDVHGPNRTKVLLSKGPGYKPKAAGIRKKKTVHGSTVSEKMAQLNLVVTKKGPKSLEELCPKPEKKD